MSKRILITGAGSGLGEGAAIGLAKEGHRVIATAPVWPQVTALRQKAANLGLSGTVLVEKLDLLDPRDIAFVHTFDIEVGFRRRAISTRYTMLAAQPVEHLPRRFGAAGLHVR